MLLELGGSLAGVGKTCPGEEGGVSMCSDILHAAFVRKLQSSPSAGGLEGERVERL